MSEFRDLFDQASKSEITYSRMVELLNERAEGWLNDRLAETPEKKEYWNTKALFSYEDIHRFEKVGKGDNRAAFVVLKELELEAKKRVEKN